MRRKIGEYHEDQWKIVWQIPFVDKNLGTIAIIKILSSASNPTRLPWNIGDCWRLSIPECCCNGFRKFLLAYSPYVLNTGPVYLEISAHVSAHLWIKLADSRIYYFMHIYFFYHIVGSCYQNSLMKNAVSFESFYCTCEKIV